VSPPRRTREPLPPSRLSSVSKERIVHKASVSGNVPNSEVGTVPRTLLYKIYLPRLLQLAAIVSLRSIHRKTRTSLELRHQSTHTSIDLHCCPTPAASSIRMATQRKSKASSEASTSPPPSEPSADSSQVLTHTTPLASSSIVITLIGFTLAMLTLPLGTYFLTVQRVFNGNIIHEMLRLVLVD
jgi:hypothetical protein